MTMRRILSTLALLSIGATAGAARAEPAEPSCLTAVETRATHLLFDVTLQLERHQVSWTGEFEALGEVVSAYRAHVASESTRACLDSSSALANRFERWQMRHARPTLDDADERLGKLCSRHTLDIIGGARRAIDKALAAQRLAVASDRADSLEDTLTTDSIVLRCEATRARVADMVSDYIPSVRAKVALPRVADELRETYATVADPWSSAKAALATSGRSIEQAPAALATAGGQSAFRARLERCGRLASSLRSLGAGADFELATASGDAVSLADAEAKCRAIAGHANTVFADVERHNAEYTETQRKLWERRNIKGWGMQKIYNELGRPLDVSKPTLGAIRWLYRDGDTCARHSFSTRGKHLSERAVACPD